MRLSKEKVLPIIRAALKEDIGTGDLTTQALIKKDSSHVRGFIFAKESGIIAGMDIAKWTFEALDREVKFIGLIHDGKQVKRFEKLAKLKGHSDLILMGERTALNFLTHLSGVSTLTNLFLQRVKGTNAKIFDTRKTTPLLRALEKYAVKVGGGYNHRMGLWDGILIKGNHIDSLELRARSSELSAIKSAIKMAREKGYKKIEIEVRNLKKFREALESGADIIMLDNFKFSDIKKGVKIRNRFCSQLPAPSSKPLIEVSGGITLQNVRQIAKLGVDMISIGALTHSAPSLDLSLRIEL